MRPSSANPSRHLQDSLIKAKPAFRAMYPKAALSASAVPQIAETVVRLPRADGRVEHSLLASALQARGFNARAFGKSTVLEIIAAVPGEFEVRPYARPPGPIFVRRRGPPL